MSEKSDKDFVKAVQDFRTGKPSGEPLLIGGGICTEDVHIALSKALNKSTKLIKPPREIELEQQNEALLAQVEELRHVIHKYAGTGLDKEWQEVKRATAKTPEQSLDSLKARIEEETIERCVSVIKLQSSNHFAGISPDSISKDWVMRDVSNIPRKYQPSNNAKVDK
ncbi:MAG: hypothetical protein KAT90_10310 [Gammaproteobacteria bacterium]|nr:hypothetical protein [Gammaproteobacteria bacterium]